jgi:hypothetical protein
VRLLARLLARCGVPAFFFFSWILQLLWNGILVDELKLAPTKLTYWQTAGLWFVVSLALAWVGIAARSTGAFRLSRRRPDEGLERTIEDRLSSREPVRDDLGERIERSIWRGFARWVDADEETDWSDLGDLIERKVKRTFRAWID